jgi:3-hydroxymyristoyl/3-hydroxydecanoyl-(acyl carrier protein) dehydratase
MTRIEFDFTVPHDHPSLAGHFPGNPVVPGVLLLDGAMDALHRACGVRIERLQRVKFMLSLRPGEHAHGHWDVQSKRAIFSLSVLRGGVPARLAEGACILEAESAA